MNNYYGNNWSGSQTSTGPISLTKVNAFMQRVYMIMMLGLAITGLTAYGLSTQLISASGELTDLAFTLFGGPQRWLLVLAPFGLVWFMSARANSLSYSTASILFALYAALLGISLSSIFIVYTASSIASTFFITAGTFGAMSFIGATTKMDLTKMGSFLLMALIGVIIASVVNLFLGSSMLSFIISIAGVIIFTGLTAYDTQKLVQVSSAFDNDSEESKKVSLFGALNLYMDFINLFLFLLRLLGSSRN